MRHLFFVAVFFVSLVVLCAGEILAQATHPTYFASAKLCTSALATGNFTPYTPKFFGLKGKNPVDETTTKVAPIEANACVQLLTTNGKQWVVQLDGTKFRWNVNSDGSLGKPYALDVCGNPAYEIAYAYVEENPVSVSSIEVAGIPGPQGPPGSQGPPGLSGPGCEVRVVGYETYLICGTQSTLINKRMSRGKKFALGATAAAVAGTVYWLWYNCYF